MSANGYNTKLNKMKRSKAQNLSSRPQSFGMKMNNQPSRNYIRQNIDTLSSNVLNGKDYISINNINLNKTKAISFGGIDEWKKWIDKNPMFKSIVQLQKYTALGAILSALSKHLSLVSEIVITNCEATKNASCDNYEEYEIKRYLNMSPSTRLSISVIMEFAEDYIKSKSSAIGAGAAFATGNPIIAALTKFGVELTEKAKVRGITAATMIEAYGGCIIAYLENRRHKRDDGSSGFVDSYACPATPIFADRKFFAYAYKMQQQYPNLKNRGHEHFMHVSQALDSEGFEINFENINRFFEHIDMKRLEKYHKIYELYMEEYIPKKMDIKETYSIRFDKEENKICIYDEIEDKDAIYVYDILPIALNNTISEEVKEEVKEKVKEKEKVRSSYSYNNSYLNSNSYRGYNNKSSGGMMLC